VLSYGVVLGLLFGPLLAYILVGVLRQSLPPAWILIPNPVSALFSALSLASGGGSPLGFVGELGRLLAGATVVDPGTGISKDVLRPLYHYSLALYATISLGLYLLATRLVRPTRRWRIRWRDVLVILGLFLALAALVVAFFVATDRYPYGILQPVPTEAPLMEAPAPPVEVMIERSVPVTVVPVPPTPTPAPTPAGVPASHEDIAE